MKINGYPVVYMPNHHLQIGNSKCVYEHVVVAEQVLGRKLKKGEVVHHIDKNREHNTPDNIIVFKTEADHARFHKTGNIQKDGDVFVSPPVINHCLNCGCIIDNDSTRCKKCQIKLQRHRMETSVTKEELDKLIHEKSFVQIGKMFGVSDNTIRNWCKNYGLPYLKKYL